ncbi:hypothetical protein BH780_gp180 [Bacillus phage Eldridge]|uniref:Uncharacterized protein n=1 Tax=Bacillus phage Eldridge TaxID=1776293 RepID=A0A0Y0ATZ8_9CAUD|nr:hypothetical protein BH780_gp180 [Bacillus phage Eldridge]AMB18763.1 hypothetical protein Eldridge_0183 [Bacillus phage Eldridge]
MKFENFYMGRVYHDPKQTIIDRLWIWYQFNSEVFDGKLPSSIPSERDPDEVIIRHPADSSLANRYAGRLMQLITDIAAIHNITVEELREGRKRTTREPMRSVINQYLQLASENRFDFIYTALSEQRRDSLQAGSDKTEIMHDIRCACIECREKKGHEFQVAIQQKPTTYFSEVEPGMEDTIKTTRYYLKQRINEEQSGIIYYYEEM